ncbi:MAG TPA: helix-turn-helix domain-containing protein [Actinomycetota bacterium]|nr:helix-turn-helix domain-containing protein [Actinomycetota bacterium]
MQSDRTTRERLLESGLRLFAERGFRGTTVGEVEESAGLVPRSGALYKHFGSKKELLSAVVERHLLELQTVGRIVDLMPLGDLRAELTLLARWVIREVDRQRELMLVFEKEGDELRDLRDQFYEVGDLSYRVAVDYVRRLVKDAPHLQRVDPEALAAIAMNALVNHRRCEWTFQRKPLELDDERMVAGLVDVLMRLARPDAVPGVT